MAESHIRLLQCMTCTTLEVLPDYEGRPEDDVLLNVLISRHRYPDGNEHFGALHRVEEKHWANADHRKEIEKRISEASQNGTTGFAPSYYHAKDTFKEDAMTCWKQHNRAPGCNDYKSEKKLLKPDTKQDRKEVGLGEARTKVYLCDFCPVKSLVQEAHFKKLGLYNN
jgi:hypothetical protein